MAVEKVINIKVNSKGAQKDMDALGKTIQEQKDITIEFEKELSRLEQQLASTSKGNLAQQKITKDRIVGLKGALKDQRISLKELNNERSKSVKVQKLTFEGATRNYGAIQLLDTVTGGFASKVRSAVDASRLFNTSLKGMKTALIATGIGALVVAIGLLVVYWDDIKKAIDDTNGSMERNIDLNNRNLDVVGSQQGFLKAQEKSLKAQGKSIKDNLFEQKKLLATKKTILDASILTLEADIKEQKSIVEKVTWTEKLWIATLRTLGMTERANQALKESVFGTKEQTDAIEDQEKKLKNLKTARENLIVETIDFNNPKDPKSPKKEKDTKIKFDDSAEKKLEDEIKFLEKLAGIRKEFADKNRDDELEQSTLDRDAKLLEIDGLLVDEAFKRTAKAEVNKFYDDQEDEINKKRRDKKEADDQEAADKEIALAERIEESKIEIRDASIQAVSDGIGLLSSLAGKSKALQKTSVLADSAIGIGKIVINKNTADLADLAHSATLGPVAGPAYLSGKKVLNTVSAGIGVAANLLATKKALSAIGSGGSPAGAGSLGGSGGGSRQAPAFNLVEGTESNQIAEGLNRQNAPIEAFVVSSAVTNKQALERNIESNSTIG